MAPHRYSSPDEDSARWDDFAFRSGDIVVSTRSKHGTTWVQTILLLLIHQDPDLPAPLAELSPWLDHLIEPRDAVVARLEAQTHRRVIKTHTPLAGCHWIPAPRSSSERDIHSTRRCRCITRATTSIESGSGS